MTSDKYNMETFWYASADDGSWQTEHCNLADALNEAWRRYSGDAIKCGPMPPPGITVYKAERPMLVVKEVFASSIRPVDYEPSRPSADATRSILVSKIALAGVVSGLIVLLGSVALTFVRPDIAEWLGPAASLVVGAFGGVLVLVSRRP